VHTECTIVCTSDFKTKRCSDTVWVAVNVLTSRIKQYSYTLTKNTQLLPTTWILDCIYNLLVYLMTVGGTVSNLHKADWFFMTQVYNHVYSSIIKRTLRSRQWRLNNQGFKVITDDSDYAAMLNSDQEKYISISGMQKISHIQTFGLFLTISIRASYAALRKLCWLPSGLKYS